MNSHLAVILIVTTIMSLGLYTANAQTFQYSRGWTNGKRNGLSGNGIYDFDLIERLVSNPCQLEKLKYILQGKPINEKLMVPCELFNPDSEADNSNLRLKRSPFNYGGKSFGNQPSHV